MSYFSGWINLGMKNTRFIGVKTTKIYCLPTCPARAPLPRNIVKNNILYKLEKFEEMPVLMKIRAGDNNAICIDFLTPRPRKPIRAKVAKYVWHWLDLDTDLRPFYRIKGQRH